MAKTVTMRLDDDTYEKLKAAASAERRSLANLIETAALRHLEESSFMDDSEVREVFSNSDLMKRLKSGHAQAKRRKGAFVRDL